MLDITDLIKPPERHHPALLSSMLILKEHRGSPGPWRPVSSLMPMYALDFGYCICQLSHLDFGFSLSFSSDPLFPFCPCFCSFLMNSVHTAGLWSSTVSLSDLGSLFLGATVLELQGCAGFPLSRLWHLIFHLKSTNNRPLPDSVDGVVRRLCLPWDAGGTCCSLLC